MSTADNPGNPPHSVKVYFNGKAYTMSPAFQSNKDALEKQRIAREQLPLFKKHPDDDTRSRKYDSVIVTELKKGGIQVLELFTKAGLALDEIACHYEPLTDCRNLQALLEKLQQQDINFFRRRGMKDNGITITLTPEQYDTLKAHYTCASQGQGR